MRTSSVRLLILSAGCGFCGALFSAESTPLAQNSPFTPGGKSGAVTSASDELYEFAGVSRIGGDTTVNIFQKSLKKGRWIPVGGRVDGITVARYDAARDQVVIRVEGGAEKVLALRKPTLAASKPGNNAPVPLPPGINAPGVAVAPAQSLPAPAPAAVTTMGSDSTGNAVGPAAPATTAQSPTPTPAPAPGSVAHQEQEARMLVSDLLEIGMAQRKAYEEAQARAAQPNASAQSGGAPAPAPTSPPPAQTPPVGPAQP